MRYMRGSTVQNSAMKDSQILNGIDRDMETAYSVRGGVLFTQAAIVLMAGLLLPIPPVAIDILLAVNLVFTGMLLFVAIMAREPAEITSVPAVVIFITLLRLGTNVAAAKSIILIANGGRIIDWCSSHIYYGFISIIAAVVLVPVICVLICNAAICIRRKAVGYLVETIPNRLVTLQTEFQTGTLTHDQMLRTKKHIEKQTKFFAGMAGTSSLLLCDGIIAVIITLATLFGATAIGFIHTSRFVDGSQQYPPLAIAIAAATAVPAVLVAMALRLLINKRFLISLKAQTPAAPTAFVSPRPVETSYEADADEASVADIEPEEHDAAFPVVIPKFVPAASAEVEAETEPIEPPDETTFEHFDESADQMQPALQEVESFDAESVEEIAETDFEFDQSPEETADIRPETPDAPAADYDEVGIVMDESSSPDQQPEIITEEPAVGVEQPVRDDYYYDSILATIGDKKKATILLAAQNASQLPVTVAVELVIRIIQLRKRCLLIDMDQARNAVAAAFDIDGSSMQGKAVPTGIENLWISPADSPDNAAAVKLSRKVANALKVFNYVVVYAPNAEAENVQQQLIGIADAAIIFGTDEEAAGMYEFAKVLVSSECKVVFEQDIKKNA